MDSNKLKSSYNEYYYNNCCGTPYVRNGAIWNFFSTVADQIVSKIAPRTVLDAGCAKGFLVEFLRQKGIEAWGFDISDYAVSNISPEIRDYCRIASVTDPIDRNYDLIICLEVLEHVSQDEAEQAIRNFCSRTSDILFSSSPSDITEPTHINVHPPEFWSRMFATYGFFRDFDFDASCVAPWAVRFRKKSLSIIDIGECYERELWLLKQKYLDKDSKLVQLQEILSQRDRQITSLNQTIVDRDGQAANLNRTIAEQDSQIVNLNQIIVKQDNQIACLNQRIADCDSQAANLNRTIAEQDCQIVNLNQIIVKQDNQIACLNQRIVDCDSQAANLNRTIAEQDCQIVNLNQIIVKQDNQIACLNQRIVDCDSQAANLNRTIAEQDCQIVNLNQIIVKQDNQIASLNQTIAGRDGHIADLSQAVAAYQKSTSWRVTIPLRITGDMTKSVKRGLHFLISILSHPGKLKRIAVKVIRIYKREGIGGVEHRIKSLRSDHSAEQITKNEGITPDFLEKLEAFAHLLLHLKQRWMMNNLCRNFGDRILNFLRGTPGASKKITQGSFRFHIDKPRLGLIKIIDGSYTVSGWAVNLKTCSAADVRIVVGNTVYNPNPQLRDDVRQAFKPTCELPVSTGFSLLLMLPIGVHRIRIEINNTDGLWVPVRRVLLLHRPSIRSLQLMGGKKSYESWTHLEQKRLKESISEIKRHIGVMIRKPVFTVIIDARYGIDGLKDTLKSICKQMYPHSETYILANHCGETESSLPANVKFLKNTSLSDIAGDFVIFMQSGQRLALHALYEFASAINQFPDIDFLYGDEDYFNKSGNRHDPFHKPDWSPDYLETFNYIGFTACYRTALAQGCFEKTHLYDFVLRFTEHTNRILHIPKILGHSPERFRTKEPSIIALDIEALSDRLGRTDRRGIVCEHSIHKGCYDIQLHLKRSPLVSIVIPTAGKTISLNGRKIDLIENVIGQIRNRSTYKNIEIIVVDNGDLSSDQIRLLAKADCRRITYSEPVFNVPKKLNLGATLARGEMLLLMNDDIEINTPSWIERLLAHFEKPHVGVAGARLLYPNGKTQHVGVVHNSGNPDHVRRLFPGNEAGYFFSTCGVRNYSAVTGACMMTPTNLYQDVGGYSEELAVSYNDADYCMKVREKGFWVVYASSVELIHMESQSRVASADLREVMWYHRRWAAKIIADEFYNERFLAVASPIFEPCINRKLI